MGMCCSSSDARKDDSIDRTEHGLEPIQDRETQLKQSILNKNHPVPTFRLNDSIAGDLQTGSSLMNSLKPVVETSPRKAE